MVIVTTVDIARAAVVESEKVYNAARRALAALLAQRKPLAMAAPSDGEASAALAANRTDVIDAELAVADASTRLDAAQAALADAEHAATDAAGEEMLVQARTLAAEIIEASTRFDRAMSDGASALERRDHLAVKLRATGCLSPAAIEALNSRSRIRSAIGAAGLHFFLNEFIAVRHRAALAASDRASIALSKPTAESEAA